MPKYGGIDPSLTSTGVVIYDTVTKEKFVGSFSSSNNGNDLANRHDRLDKLSTKATTPLVEGNLPSMVAIEGPAHSSSVGKIWDRAGLWHMTVQKLVKKGIPVIEVPPTTRSKYATGKGNAGKDEVLLAVARNYPEWDIKNNDEADALIIMAIAARLSGHPIEDHDLPKNKLDALNKLKKD